MEDKSIAIIGAGCRFPGVDSIDEFWKVIVNGENDVKEVPDQRLNNDAFYDQRVLGKICVKKAGLLKRHNKWNNRLFGISDLEASQIDPQQRYVLRYVHMALEDGGITKEQISGTNTGVIIGCANDDYNAMADSDRTDYGNYNATGTARSGIAAGVSYAYNLHGTCLTLDTACSSSLIAIHLGAQAIQSGDCDMVICGWVSSILTPDSSTALGPDRSMSTIGQCPSRDGCGIVILKSLKRALDDGNNILATIKTGTSQNGCTAKRTTATSGEQQIELSNHVYTVHRFSPSYIQSIEVRDPKMEPRSNVGNGHRPSTTKQESLQNDCNTTLQSERKSLLISDTFKKQTRHGWDHSVQVSLYILDGQTPTLEWGKARMDGKRVLDLRHISEVSFRTVNGISNLMLSYQTKVLILKTPNRPKAERWMNVIEERIRTLKCINILVFGVECFLITYFQMPLNYEPEYVPQFGYTFM